MTDEQYELYDKIMKELYEVIRKNMPEEDYNITMLLSENFRVWDAW